MKSWKELDLALVGIGSLEPSPLLRQSGNALTEAEQAQLRSAGAVGDVCLRFFDLGVTVMTTLDQRVMSIASNDLRNVPRLTGVAGEQEVPCHPGGAARRLGQRPRHRPRHGPRPGRRRARQLSVRTLSTWPGAPGRQAVREPALVTRT